MFSLFAENIEFYYICQSELLLLLTIYNIVRIMKKRKLLLMLICCIGTVLFPLSTFAASYSGYVGDEFQLVKPSVSILATKIKDVTWSGQYADGISCYENSTGLKVRITSYFKNPIYINCRVKYEWSNGQGTYTSDKTESYMISCNPVTIQVTNNNMTLKVGQKQYIDYNLSPSKSASLTFTSDNSSVATVNSMGEVTAVGTGYAKITIDQNMGDKAYCNVTVTEPVAATSISLPSERTVDVYSSITLIPTLEPSDANPTLTWESSNVTIASVNQNGKVTGNEPGTVIITVTTDNDLSASCTVTVKDVDRTPTQFYIDDAFRKKTVYVGNTWLVTYSVLPSYANYNLRWTSSDERVATVDDFGHVKAIRQGTARIAGTIDGTTLTDYCDVIVKAIPNVLTIWFANGQSSSIKLDENIKVTVEKDKFIVKSNTVDIVYDALDVMKFTLESDVSVIPGDANGDGVVNVSDIVEIVNYILGNPSARFNFDAANVNGDTDVNVTDIVGVVSIILSSNAHNFK